jgi:hypothetical protein
MKKIFSNSFFNQSGMSLIEVLVAVGLIGGVAVSLMQSRDVLNSNRRVLNQRMEEDNIFRSIHMLLNDKIACGNTLARAGLNLDPDTTTLQPFTQIRDENNNVIYSNGMVLGRGGGSPVRIGQMGISHFQMRTTNAPSTGPVYWNNANQATVTVELQRVSDLALAGSGVATSGAQGSITRRFQVLVERNGSGVITNCLAERDFFADTFCDIVSGTVDANDRCRSISLSLAGNSVPLPSINNVAIRVTPHARIDGVTAITDKVELGDPATFFTSPTTNNSNRGLHARSGSFVDGYVLSTQTEIPAMGPLGAISLMETGNIHIPNNVAVGAGTAPTGGLFVQGNLIAPRIKLFGMEELVNASAAGADHPVLQDNANRNFAASVGYVARRISNTLTDITGADEGSFQNVLADILSNAPIQPEGALALFRYVCTHTTVRGFNGVTTTGAFAMVGGVPRCRLNFGHRMVNCSIDPGPTGNPNNVTATPSCTNIVTDRLHLGGDFITNWNSLRFAP